MTTDAEEAEKARLANLPLAEVLERARRTLIEDLAAKSAAGTLTKDDARLLRDLLKDNGMTLVPPKPDGVPEPERPDKPFTQSPLPPPDYEED